MDFLIDYGYIGVFIAAFLAATVLPLSSEAVLAGILLAGASYWPCMIAATLGNFLGAMTCYWVGLIGKIEWIEKYLKINMDKLLNIQNWLKGKGAWIGFFAFLPLVGDFIVVGLGLMRANLWITAISVLLGKSVRYWLWIELVFKAKGAF
ncbi:MAG: VTT domain-containing protein [Tannerella sp.]|jgi:membrane protein YqaA with SNARE-associated domain|nr:VTT domain-containing protein [Tannerella sp.]